MKTMYTLIISLALLLGMTSVPEKIAEKTI
jgi:hypothetical protein